MNKTDLQTIGQAYKMVENKTTSKIEGKISKDRTIKVYSMGENNPVIRIDIKQNNIK